MPYVYLNDADIYYESRGEGTPVMVLLHGNGQSHRVMRGIGESFASGMQVLLPDTRGHGLSVDRLGPEVDLRISLLRTDLRAFLDALGIRKVVLVGFSDGGNIALSFAQTYPERALACISIGANANPNGLRPLVRTFGAWKYRCSEFFRTISPSRARRRMHVKSRKRAALLTRSPRMTKETLSGITCPVLLVRAKWDIVDRRQFKRMAEVIPNCTKRTVPGLHNSFLKSGEKGNAMIRQFLEESGVLSFEIAGKEQDVKLTRE